jgi:hypothetical protein
VLAYGARNAFSGGRIVDLLAGSLAFFFVEKLA